MLRGIHKASSGWIGKAIMAVVMGLLVVSFAIWGIGDIFRGFGQSSFAPVGSPGISAGACESMRKTFLGGRASRSAWTSGGTAVG